MTKITTIEAKSYQGKVTGHSILLDNHISGYLDDKGSDKELQIGEAVEYTLVVKQNKQGKDYNLLTLKRATAQSTPPVTPPQSLQVNTNKFTGVPTTSTPTEVVVLNERFESAREAMRQTMKAVCEDKIEWDKVGESFKLVNTCLQEAIDDIVKE